MCVCVYMYYFSPEVIVLPQTEFRSSGETSKKLKTLTWHLTAFSHYGLYSSSLGPRRIKHIQLINSFTEQHSRTALFRTYLARLVHVYAFFLSGGLTGMMMKHCLWLFLCPLSPPPPLLHPRHPESFQNIPCCWAGLESLVVTKKRLISTITHTPCTNHIDQNYFSVMHSKGRGGLGGGRSGRDLFIKFYQQDPYIFEKQGSPQHILFILQTIKRSYTSLN